MTLQQSSARAAARATGNHFGSVAFGSFSALRRSEIQTPPPSVNRYLAVEVGEACQLACKHCIYGRPNPPNARPAKVVRDRLLEALSNGIDPLWVSYAGKEPTLFPKQLFELAESSRRDQRLNIVMTNGLRLGPTFLTEAYALIDQFDISVDGDRAAHDWMRGEGTFDRTWRNLERLVEDGRVDVGVIATAVNAVTTTARAQTDDIAALAARMASAFGIHPRLSLSISLYYGPPGDPLVLNAGAIARLISRLSTSKLRSRVLLTANYAYLWPAVRSMLPNAELLCGFDARTQVPIASLGSTDIVLFNQTESLQVPLRLANDGNVFLGCNHLTLGDRASAFAIGHLESRSIANFYEDVETLSAAYLPSLRTLPEECEACPAWADCRGGDRLSGLYFGERAADPRCSSIEH